MKVAIVNDVKIAAEVLRRILAELPGFELVWTAYSGEEALELCARERPDIVLMDLIMPGIGGAETTRRIMQTTPCVVLVVTATTVGNRDEVFEAMGYGALDAVNTPTLGPNGDMAGAEPLLQKLRMVARLVSPHRGPAAAQHHSEGHQGEAQHQSGGHHAASRGGHAAAGPAIVAIGASTGGPQALAQILGALPSGFPAAVLVAQHVDEHFAPGLAAWLQHHSALPVKLARSGEHVHAGGVWIAGKRDHLAYEAASGTLYYTPEPEETPYRPSVDVLFGSVAEASGVLRVGVLLTGMGRDGAEGLLALRESGGHTIAQDAASSVVYGMPRAAVELHAAEEILPLGGIAARLKGLVPEHQESGHRGHTGHTHKGRP